MSRMPTITEMLRRTIKESGLSLAEIERETGVERRSISAFLRGTRSMRVENADKLAAYFKLKLVTAPRRK